MTNFKDYDALTSEREEFVRRIGGRDIEFRKVLPARLVLDIRRKASKKMTDDDQESFGFELIEQIIGAESYEHVASHLSVEQLTELVTDALTYYGLGAEAEEEGKAEGEEPPSPSSESSQGGEPSTPTSSDITPKPDEGSTREASTGTPSSAELHTFPLAHSS